MKRLSVCLFTCLLAAVVGLGALQSPNGLTAFVNVTVIPMDRERTLPNQTVVVRDGRIAELGPAASIEVPDGAVRVEAAGRYLLPALAEMHAHIPGGQATDQAIEKVLALYAAHGIGTARGMLGHARHLPLRERSRGPLFAPLVYTSGPSLNGNSVPTKEAAIRAVEAQKAEGYDFLKIHPGITREVFEALADAAKGAGIRFAGHVPLDVGLERALELRFATIDHLDGYVEALVRDEAPVTAAGSQFFGLNLVGHLDESKIPALVAATREAGTWMVPTESLIEHSVSEDSPETMARWPEMVHVPLEQIAQWVEGKKKLMASVPAESRREFIAVRRRLIRALHAGGVGFLLGSDAPQVWNVPGFSVHRELAILVEAGLTPYQAIETGTRNVAAFFGTLEEAGTLAAGKRATLLLLEQNPLDDIRNTAKIAGVMLRGTWYPRSELDRRLQAVR